MILTDNEMDLLTGKLDIDGLTRAVEAAVLAKLAQGVDMPKPFPAGYIAKTEYFYTSDQLRTYGAAARVKALEDAAVVCEELLKASGHDYEYGGCEEAAQKIRALKGGA